MSIYITDDAGKLYPLSGGTATQGSNPNILINGDFRVNQRGLSEYNPKTAWGNYTYTCDRWAIYGLVSSKFSVETKRLTGQTWILQTIDDFKGLLGKTLTFSMKFNQLSNDYINFTFRKIFTDGTKESIDKRFYPSTGSQTINHTFDLLVDNEKTISRLELILYQGANGDIEIDYIKLEFGKVATPNIPRPYAEELAMCQRYYQTINTVSSLLYARTDTQLRAMLNFKVKMRTKPTVTQQNVIRVYAPNEETTFTQTNAGLGGGTAIHQEGAMLAILNFTGLTKTNIYQFDLNWSTEPIFTADAEIYN